MIGRFFRSLTKFSGTLFVIDCFLIAASIVSGDFPYILMPSHDYSYVLENGIKNGQHIKGEIFYSIEGFASKESYTQYETYRTASETDGYYYVIPVGEYGMAAIYVHKDDVAAMERLTEETYNYVMGGEVPQTSIYFDGVVKKMDKELEGLEDAFREELEYLGYTESEVEEMLSNFSGGECLVLSGPKDISTVYVMFAIEFIMILWTIILFIRNYRVELECDRSRENGMMRPEGVTKQNMYETSQTYYYVNK